MDPRSDKAHRYAPLGTTAGLLPPPTPDFTNGGHIPKFTANPPSPDFENGGHRFFCCSLLAEDLFVNNKDKVEEFQVPSNSVPLSTSEFFDSFLPVRKIHRPASRKGLLSPKIDDRSRLASTRAASSHSLISNENQEPLGNHLGSESTLSNAAGKAGNYFQNKPIQLETAEYYKVSQRSSAVFGDTISVFADVTLRSPEEVEIEREKTGPPAFRFLYDFEVPSEHEDRKQAELSPGTPSGLHSFKATEFFDMEIKEYQKSQEEVPATKKTYGIRSKSESRLRSQSEKSASKPTSLWRMMSWRSSVSTQDAQRLGIKATDKGGALLSRSSNCYLSSNPQEISLVEKDTCSPHNASVKITLSDFENQGDVERMIEIFRRIAPDGNPKSVPQFGCTPSQEKVPLIEINEQLPALEFSSKEI